MSIDRDSASASLAEIASVERRTREALIYAGSSWSLLVWGVLVAAGYVLTHFYLEWGNVIWSIVLGIGMVLTVIFHVLKTRVSERVWDRRVTYALFVMVAFGIYWESLIGQHRGRELSAFWPTLFMFGYVIAGFWLGRFFTICGVIVTALTLVGYFWIGPWFYLWMAVVAGGGLLAGGLWLRRMG